MEKNNESEPGNDIDPKTGDFLTAIEKPLPNSPEMPPIPKSPDLSIEAVRAKIEQEEAKKTELTELWAGESSFTRQGVIEAMRRDGLIMAHATDLNSLVEAMQNGVILPTAIRNVREGRPFNQKRKLHASFALHFSMNHSYYKKTRRKWSEGENPTQFAMFITHPGIMLANHDVSFGGWGELDPGFLEKGDDVGVSGKSYDHSDKSHEVDIRNGIFLIEDINIDPETGQPTHLWTKAQWEEYKKSPYAHWEPKDDIGPFSIPAHEYFGQMMSDLPEGERLNFMFIPKTENMEELLAGFRQINKIPEPNGELFVQEIGLFNPQVISKSEQYDDDMASGGGTFFRVNIEKKQNNIE